MHLSTGDQNSLLRYFGILRSQECDLNLKCKAGSALLLSLQHEIVPQSFADSIQNGLFFKDSDIRLSAWKLFPALRFEMQKT
jgi:hypothetical protein